jgi:LPS O-antigen subunit length determinant protein (WzzB/FepE family)
MMSDTQAGYSQVPVDDEIDLKELFMVLWGGKWLISAITGVAAVRR